MTCSVTECERDEPYLRRGLCNAHYQRLRLGRLRDGTWSPRHSCEGCNANPWHHVAPLCPVCSEPMFRYFPGRSLWRCVACHEDFEAAS